MSPRKSAPSLSDVLAHMHARRQINEVQFAAGRKLQSYYERAKIGGPQRITFTAPSGETEELALAKISTVEKALGVRVAELMRNVLCLGYMSR
jgi:hypothetical protein